MRSSWFVFSFRLSASSSSEAHRFALTLPSRGVCASLNRFWNESSSLSEPTEIIIFVGMHGNREMDHAGLPLQSAGHAPSERVSERTAFLSECGCLSHTAGSAHICTEIQMGEFEWMRKDREFESSGQVEEKTDLESEETATLRAWALLCCWWRFRPHCGDSRPGTSGKRTVEIRPDCEQCIIWTHVLHFAITVRQESNLWAKERKESLAE